MASSTGTPAARGSSVGSFRSSRVTCNRLLYQVMRFSQRAVYTYYFIHIFTADCNTFLWVVVYSVLLDLNMLGMTTKKSNGYYAAGSCLLPGILLCSPECHVGRNCFTNQPTCDRGEFSTSLRECTETLETNNT